MYAHQGDRIVVRSQTVDGLVRDGEILAVEHPDGSPPYRVRWSDNGHESLFFPGPDACIDNRDATHAREVTSQVTSRGSRRTPSAG
jgi:hypothetical protein